jgi:hypothetical protein
MSRAIRDAAVRQAKRELVRELELQSRFQANPPGEPSRSWFARNSVLITATTAIVSAAIGAISILAVQHEQGEGSAEDAQREIRAETYEQYNDVASEVTQFVRHTLYCGRLDDLIRRNEPYKTEDGVSVNMDSVRNIAEFEGLAPCTGTAIDSTKLAELEEATEAVSIYGSGNARLFAIPYTETLLDITEYVPLKFVQPAKKFEGRFFPGGLQMFRTMVMSQELNPLPEEPFIHVDRN